ncbi:SIR2 family protein [Microbulbifer celer]|uniref:SIR2 family protein n=1 Tax=Microbulbifer celer TaxID=435905 RepID=A0ABW3UCC0_9GAMM|nr:SIR2 family protein [Microbulbifer celer]UFN56368.1 SIR2 family protein [Microbulbifer celer]
MNNQEVPNIEGMLAYLKPRSDKWDSLCEESFKALLQEPEARALNEEEKGELEKNKQHINDVLLKSLQLPNLSFFAGSGTSLAEVNGPSMWDLWKKSMLKYPNAEKSDEGFGVLTTEASSTLDKVKYTELEHPNIEYFLSQCDAYLLFNEDEEVDSFLNKVKNTILHECSSFINTEQSDISCYQSLLQKLARRRVRDPRLKVFTTNYDMCFETAASDLGMMIVDGFSYTRNRKFDGKYFNYDVVRRESDNHEFVEGVVQLYKLHGSVSWERRESSVFETNSPAPENAVLIYPAKGKYQQAFIQPHLELLSRFLESLRQPNSCLIMAGFGFNDDHLSEPIISSIKSNPSLKLIIADYKAASNIKNSTKETSPYWEELSELASQGYDIHFINGSFSEFVSIIPHLRALTPADQLAKAVKAAGR